MKIIDPYLRAEEEPDELDRLLRSFFRSQLPSPWPALKLPAPAGASTWWQRSRSRLALAASIALLLLGSWWLASKSAHYQVPTPVVPGAGAASKVDVPEKLRMLEEKKNREGRPAPINRSR
jgi:hypothetical protein